MPVKTRKPSRRHRTDTRRNRSGVRSRESRVAHASVTTRMESPTISAFKRALVRSPETVLRSAYVVPAAKKLRPSFSTLLPPNPQVTINPDAWYRLLARNTDLCYLTLSGQFNPKNGYYLNTGSDSISIAGAFRALTPKNHFQGRYVVSGSQRITYSPKFADQQTRVIISDAVQLGKRFANNPTADQYAHLFGENGPASSMDFSFPYGSTFSQAVSYILNANNIDPKTFSYRSHLDPNIYSKLKNNPNYIPEAQTCKAIFFAIHPTVPLARTLYELAKYYFGNSKDDLMLLTFFALFDYDINKYNETMRILGYPQLGSKNYGIRRR